MKLTSEIRRSYARLTSTSYDGGELERLAERISAIEQLLHDIFVQEFGECKTCRGTGHADSGYWSDCKDCERSGLG